MKNVPITFINGIYHVLQNWKTVFEILASFSNNNTLQSSIIKTRVKLF